MATSPKRYDALQHLRTDIDHVLDAGYTPEQSFRNFLVSLQISAVTVGDFDRIILRGYFSHGSAYGRGDVLPNTAEMYATLSDSEKLQLREHYFSKLNAAKLNFPDLCLEFDSQFR